VRAARLGESGVVLLVSEDPRRDAQGSLYPSPRRAPWPGFALAAQAAVQLLNDRLGLDLWMVTHVEDDRQVVVASAGNWVDLARPGHAFSWAESFCLPMSEQRGPTIAPDIAAIPDYAMLATGVLARVQAYVGVPLESRNGQLFGTLCAFGGEPRGEDLSDALDLVQLVAQMLSTILAGEQLALDRSQDAASAYALAETDPLTGLRNRRGWETSLASEEERIRRYGSTASVLLLEVSVSDVEEDRADQAVEDELLLRCAGVLSAMGRPADVCARLDGDTFGLLAVECDAACARALHTRISVRLRSAGIVAARGSATRQLGGSLADTCRRAESLLRQDRQRLLRRQGAARD
jgi:diguanylate cyclase